MVWSEITRENYQQRARRSNQTGFSRNQFKNWELDDSENCSEYKRNYYHQPRRTLMNHSNTDLEVKTF